MNNEQFEQPKRIRKEIKVIGTPKMKVYLSGAISSDKNHKKKFEHFKDKYIKRGYEVLSPIETEAYKTKQSNEMMEGVDIMIQIDNPQKSRGMQIEQRIADYCNITVIREYTK